MAKMNVFGTEIGYYTHKEQDYISLTEMYNPDYNPLEFEGIINQAGLKRFAFSVKQWVEKPHSIGIITKAGRYGGTFAHKDLAFEFAS